LSNKRNYRDLIKPRVYYRTVKNGPKFKYNSWHRARDISAVSIRLHAGAKPSTATLTLPEARIEDDLPFDHGDQVRIELDGQTKFSGFLVSHHPSCAAGDSVSNPQERVSLLCLDHRWLLATCCTIDGSIYRTVDDYDGSGDPISDSAAWLSGRRCIFNAGGDPDMSQHSYTDPEDFTIPIFAADSETAKFWTAGDMIDYLTSSTYNFAHPIVSTGGMGSDTVLLNQIVDSLNLADAIDRIAKQAGYTWYLAYDSDGTADIEFVQIGSGPSRTVHLPARDSNAGDIAGTDVVLRAFEYDNSITNVINTPIGIGSPNRIEFTAQLVPAWNDENLNYTVGADMFLDDPAIYALTDPNTNSYYQRYHPSGSAFRPDVCRKWVLNEAGAYTAEPYNRGDAFDFRDAIDPALITDSDDLALFAQVRRHLLSPLEDRQIVVEFSFDGGSTWQVLPGTIRVLDDEFGIYIAEYNLANIAPPAAGMVADSGDWSEVPLNLFTSLCEDHANSGDWTNGWYTRVRVTASVQMDTRLRDVSDSSSNASPYEHSAIFDMSERYGYASRAASSVYADNVYTNANTTIKDDSYYLAGHLASIRYANQDASISGFFTTVGLAVDFNPGDVIPHIAGRNIPLNTGGRSVYVIEITHDLTTQSTTILTRDRRYSRP